jgi:hypothetical protein
MISHHLEVVPLGEHKPGLLIAKPQCKPLRDLGAETSPPVPSSDRRSTLFARTPSVPSNASAAITST